MRTVNTSPAVNAHSDYIARREGGGKRRKRRTGRRRREGGKEEKAVGMSEVR
jgi:hypothetical protein